MLQTGIVKTAQNIWNTQPLRNALKRLKLLLVESDVIVFANILDRLQQLRLQMFSALFLLSQNCAFEVQIVFLVEHFKESRVGTSINADFLEFVPEMIFDGLLFEGRSVDDHVVFTLQHETIQDEVLFFQ